MAVILLGDIRWLHLNRQVTRTTSEEETKTCTSQLETMGVELHGQFYPIGKSGVPWGAAEKAEWLRTQTVKRSYEEEVVKKVLKLEDGFDVVKYGVLNYKDKCGKDYELYALKTKDWNAANRNILITGGVHGYETSGVQGAMEFAKTKAKEFEGMYNFLIAPCCSPWGYECVQRWNPDTYDPNRSFTDGTPVDECRLFLKLLKDTPGEFTMHIDLHETTDTDETEFRRALAARDGTEWTPGTIPDGFYVVGDELNPQFDLQKAIIEAVRKVTHIAPPDSDGEIIGKPINFEGIIVYPYRDLGLCAGSTDSKYTSTTEVYPDSDRATDEICNQAQVAAVVGALQFINSEKQN